VETGSKLEKAKIASLKGGMEKISNPSTEREPLCCTVGSSPSFGLSIKIFSLIIYTFFCFPIAVLINPYKIIKMSKI
jgi:hypothetical protein